MTSSFCCVFHCHNYLNRGDYSALMCVTPLQVYFCFQKACKVMGCKNPCQCRTFVSAAATRSIAPPIPFTIFPGIIQLARSPHRDTFTSNETVWKIPNVTVKLYCFSTCMAPRMVRPTWPPRIMAKLSSLEKKELPGIAVTVCLPALIRSGSTCKIYRCWKYFMRVSFTCWL